MSDDAGGQSRIVGEDLFGLGAKSKPVAMGGVRRRLIVTPQLSISAENDEEEDDDVGVLGGATRITGHSPGWTVFENLYLFNGTLFIVT